MKSLVTLLCIISALVVSVISYKCYYCVSPNSTTCQESETQCLGNRCITASQYFNVGGHTFNSIYKGCANETLCGTNGSAVVGNMTFRFYPHCCIGDLCNSQGYELPEEDLKPNGLECPSAHCLGTLEECKSGMVMNCTGSMDSCLEFRGIVKHPDGTYLNYSVKGCINNATCKTDFESNIMLEVIKTVYLKC
ncbi:protein RoBo-1-like [Anomaloglossus baeobatrachus]|uniref:protein RoBo-1-like n=1 Tax=Anomaloglossus baeobatrachus TaxID=238106 RepID=UPI003F4F9691